MKVSVWEVVLLYAGMLKESLVSSALCSGVFAELCSMGAITLSLICPVSFVFAVTGFTGWDAPVMLSFCTGCSVTSVLVTLFPLSVMYCHHSVTNDGVSGVFGGSRT